MRRPTMDIECHDVIGGKAPDSAPLPLLDEPPPRIDKPRARIDEVQLHSDLVEDVLGTPPRWLVRWGVTLIALALVALVALCWVIRYPDIVPASVVVTTLVPPSGVVAQASGELVEVHVREGDQVKRGALLAAIRSSVDPEAVFRLQALLMQLGPDFARLVVRADFRETLSLGELQTEYSSFLRDYQALRFYAEEDPARQEIRALEPQLTSGRARQEEARHARDLLAQAVMLSGRDYARARELATRQNISARDVDTRERDLLQQRRDLANADADLAMMQVDIDRVGHEIAMLQMRDRQQHEELLRALSQSDKNLRSRLAVWERSYVLRAPIDGRVSLFSIWTDHQYVRNGDTVLSIVPEGDQTLVARLSVPVANSGKVAVGQAVYIQLDNFPWAEFGQLRGAVQSISPVPREARYAIEVALSDGLRTTYGRQLGLRQEMQGSASIVVEDMSLFERIFYQFRKLLAGHRQLNRP